MSPSDYVFLRLLENPEAIPTEAEVTRVSDDGCLLSLRVAFLAPWHRELFQKRGVFFGPKIEIHATLFLDHKKQWTDPMTLGHFLVELARAKRAGAMFAVPQPKRVDPSQAGVGRWVVRKARDIFRNTNTNHQPKGKSQ